MKKIINNSGMTLVELLAATLIMLLVSMGMVAGISLSNKEFITSIRQSEAQEIYSTLSNLITNELRYTTMIKYKNGSNSEVESFYSVTYAIKDDITSLVSLDEDDKETNDYGYLAFGHNGSYNKILGASSYPNNLGAKVSITYKETSKLFEVELDIGTIGGSSITKKKFSVRSVNNISFGS